MVRQAPEHPSCAAKPFGSGPSAEVLLVSSGWWLLPQRALVALLRSAVAAAVSVTADPAGAGLAAAELFVRRTA